MPVDPAAGHAPARTGDVPYVCSTYQQPPGASNRFAIQHGYCRTSLDLHEPHDKIGSSDPRCPADCPHKAPHRVTVRFQDDYALHGAQAAADGARKSKQLQKKELK